jgi:hypothetical protein
VKTEELVSVLAGDVEPADASQIHAVHHRRVWVQLFPLALDAIGALAFKSTSVHRRRRISGPRAG